ncbi:divalent-cation tolerance protein CutA [Asticcacaulis sp. BYS171W]|uniref:Divalent-cation tolerance protein CutA n=1 Tax=Asticcacaulis aquaticus TaxID=2984212 RepID=A0ABT5HYR7_9CAUL|nr:divalent-cation tolerance protein CutA [Asticcacaulis aquaticus]MDC7685225.1 divalent-cation tolerance protein CutA [Asticcacaulis aquaticus]
MTDILTVSITCATEAEGERLAHLLVVQKLAACVQMTPIRSTYRWQGEIETANEVVLTAKTVSAKLFALEALVKSEHSYEVPEILATRVEWASADYAAWLREALI